MPTSWNYGRVLEGYDDQGNPRHRHEQQATLSCPTCSEAITFAGRREQRQSGEEVALDGRRVTDVFRFVTGRGRFTTSCRSCERTARQRAAGRRGTLLGAEGRAFGVELEFNVPAGLSYGDIARALRGEAGVDCTYDDYYGNSGGWVVKGDGSLGSSGCEVTSPPLRGEAGFDDLRRVCLSLERLGCTVDRRCGTHVHHDAGGSSASAIKRFVRSWHENQSLIDGLVASSRRSGGSSYCAPLTADEVRRIEAVDDLDGIGYLDIDRYRTVNVGSYSSHGTIEVRQHQGTLDPEKIRSWVRLGQAMLDDAEARMEPRSRADCVRSMLDTLRHHLDPTARTFLLGRAVEFGHAPVTA